MSDHENEMNEALKNMMSPMLEGFIALHTVFTDMLAAGFTERQACMVIAEMIRGSAQ